MENEQPKDNESTAERSNLTSAQCSMLRFEDHISIAGNLLCGQPTITQLLHCFGVLKLAFIEVARWSIITKAEREEGQKIKSQCNTKLNKYIHACNLSKKNKTTNWNHPVLHPDSEWSAVRVSLEAFYSIISKMAIAVYGEKRKSINKNMILYG